MKPTELTHKQIDKIRMLFVDGIPRSAIAKRFSISVDRVRSLTKDLAKKQENSRKALSLDLSRTKLRVPAMSYRAMMSIKP